MLQAKAAYRDAWIAAQRNAVVAPVTGYVAERSVQLGQHIQAGQALMTVIPLNSLWVDANFKEVQLRNLRIGQPAEVRSDLYGGSFIFHGHVKGMSAGTGAAFSLLPAQNASGNWIKVVQRVPVRIQIDDDDLVKSPLRVGLSATVTVDTTIARRTGAGACRPTDKPVGDTQVYTQDLDKANAEADAVVRRNLEPALARQPVLPWLNPHGRRRPNILPLRGGKLLLLTARIATASFMEILDMTIVNVSVPHISGSLGVSTSEGTWAVSSYMLAAAVMQPLTGWIGRRFGEVRTFVTSILLFMCFSALCGLATSLPMLVGARLMQGFVSGPMMSVAQAILLRNYPIEKRGMAIALWAMVIIDRARSSGPSSAAGSRTILSWPWLFYINLPVGAFAAAVSWSHSAAPRVVQSETAHRSRRARAARDRRRQPAIHAG